MYYGISGRELWSSKYVEETLSRDGYTCEIKVDPLASLYIFSGCSLVTTRNEVWSTFKLFEKWTLIHFWFSMQSLKVKQCSFSEQFDNGHQTSLLTRDLKKKRKYVMPRKWIKVHFTCIFNTWKGLLRILDQTPG